MSVPLLAFEHTDVSYGGFLAVRDVCATLGAGRVLGVVGESGSGKSTLIRAAMGLLGSAGAVTRGDILYERRSLMDNLFFTIRSSREWNVITQNLPSTSKTSIKFSRRQIGRASCRERV